MNWADSPLFKHAYDNKITFDGEFNSQLIN